MKTNRVFNGFAELAKDTKFCTSIMTAEEKVIEEEGKKAAKKVFKEVYTSEINKANNAYVESIRSRYDMGLAYTEEKKQKLASLLEEKFEEYFEYDAFDQENAHVEINETVKGIIGDHQFRGFIAELDDGTTKVVINNNAVIVDGEPDVDQLVDTLIK